MMFVEGKSSAQPSAFSDLASTRLTASRIRGSNNNALSNPLEPLLDSKGLVPTVDDVLSITREYL
jgi:hypothetical protein